MSYATVDDAISLYGEDYVLVSVDRDKDGEADPSAIEDALGQASSEIDSYIAFKYDVPISPSPKILVKYCVDIAIYQSSPGTLARTKEKRQRYEDAIAWLKAVSKGMAAIVIDGPTDPEPDQSNEPVLSAGTREMTRSKMSGLL